LQRTIWSSRPGALKRAEFAIMTVASAFQGANTLLHACFAHPGEETFRCTSPGRIPIQYMVDRWPTG